MLFTGVRDWTGTSRESTWCRPATTCGTRGAGCPRKRLTAPLPEDADQVERYAADLQRAHPELTIARHVAYTIAGAGGRLPAADSRD